MKSLPLQTRHITPQIVERVTPDGSLSYAVNEPSKDEFFAYMVTKHGANWKRFFMENVNDEDPDDGWLLWDVKTKVINLFRDWKYEQEFSE